MQSGVTFFSVSLFIPITSVSVYLYVAPCMIFKASQAFVQLKATVTPWKITLCVS